MTVEKVYAGGRLCASPQRDCRLRVEEEAEEAVAPARSPIGAAAQRPGSLQLMPVWMPQGARAWVIPTETALFALAREKGYLRERLDERYPGWPEESLLILTENS
ncbi:MAG: hypothetical protein U5R30_16045 [Deltaproteobacteria bacterium]|nr:hypothetical protein [Deltaproteobacteria bacterium]